MRCALVTLGGSAAVHGQAPLLTAAAAQAFPRAQLLVTTGLPAADGLEVERLPEQSTMLDAITRADIAITAAGMTVYELACAGVPFLALVVAGNQERVGRALEQTGSAPRLTPAPDWTATRSVNASSSSRTLPGGRAWRPPGRARSTATARGGQPRRSSGAGVSNAKQYGFPWRSTSRTRRS